MAVKEAPVEAAKQALSLEALIQALRVLEHAPVAIAVVAGAGHRFVFANIEYRNAFADGTPIVGRTVPEVFPSIGDEAAARLARIYATGRREFFREHETRRELGSSFWDLENAPFHGANGAVEAIVVTARNVTDHVLARRRATALAAEVRRRAAAAWESEERFRIMAEAVPEILFTARADGQCDFVNQRFTAYTGMAPEEALTSGWARALHPEDVERNRSRWWAAASRGEPYENEFRLRRADGSYCWFVARSLPVRGEDGRILRWIGSCTDINDLKRLNNELKKASKQKDVLLKEVNHRVKNSLQLIASLLSLQSRAATTEARQQFGEAIRRIHVVADVHQRLYQTADVERVAFGPYLREFCASLADTLASRERAVRLSVDAAEIDLAADQVVPIGLIVNELVTNVFKHAYPEGAAGAVRVESRRRADGWLWITVADDGKGLPKGFRPESSDTLGMKLVRALTKQLGGRFELLRGRQGAAFRLGVPIRDRSA